MARNFRSLLISMLALWHDLSQKQIGAGAGIPQKRVSRVLAAPEMADELFERLLAAVARQPAEAEVVTACLEGLEALEQTQDLSDEELAMIEKAAAGAARLAREGLAEALRRSRLVSAGGYPEASSLVPARQRAAELLERLKVFPTESRMDVVRADTEFQTWALCEAVCEQSVREASRDLGSAASLARLAREIAERTTVPEGNRLRGYAVAHEANVLRVTGELKAAEAGLEKAKHLWQSGSDPFGVLDPGRLFHLEASLRREQRRFDEAMSLLDQAAAVSYPERALVSKGFTLEVMGEYERAIETLLQAAPLADRAAEPRLRNIVRLNLSINLCHVGRYGEAAKLLEETRPLAAELGDEIDLIRILWVEGRVAAGLKRSVEARNLLNRARTEFAVRGMFYDVALTLLEEAVLLLDEGWPAEVKKLAPKLTEVFESKGVHREALAALRLFQQAVECDEATTELARQILRFLFRARHDQELHFKS